MDVPVGVGALQYLGPANVTGTLVTGNDRSKSPQTVRGFKPTSTGQSAGGPGSFQTTLLSVFSSCLGCTTERQWNILARHWLMNPWAHVMTNVRSHDLRVFQSSEVNGFGFLLKTSEMTYMFICI